MKNLQELHHFYLICVFLSARFSPEDKYSRQRIIIKKRFSLLPTQKPAPVYWFWRKRVQCKIWVFRSSEDSSHHLGCDAAWCCSRISTFWRTFHNIAWCQNPEDLNLKGVQH